MNQRIGRICGKHLRRRPRRPRLQHIAFNETSQPPGGENSQKFHLHRLAPPALFHQKIIKICCRRKLKEETVMVQCVNYASLLIIILDSFESLMNIFNDF